MDNKKEVFDSFIKKASAKLNEGKKEKRVTLYVPGIDQNIVIRSLTYDEIAECMETDETKDINAGDKYAIYLSAVEPSLKQAASMLLEKKVITEHMEIMDMFTMAEIKMIATEVMKLSGAISDKKVIVVDGLKN